MQPVGGREVAGGDPGGVHPVRLLPHLAHPQRQHRNAQPRGPFGERGVQFGTAHPAPRPGAEARLGLVPAVHVPDAAQRPAADRHAELGQRRDRPRHQALAAGLVHRAGARLGHHHLQPGPGGVDRGGQSGRAAAGHQQVDHGAATGAARAGPARSAAFSQRSRTASSARFSGVKHSAVIQHPSTSGSARPSRSTAR